MKAEFLTKLNMKSTRYLILVVCVALILSIGTIAVLATSAAHNKPKYHFVSAEEYAAIQSGNTVLDDRTTLDCRNPDTKEQIAITIPIYSSEFHVVTDEEYVDIQFGETSVDD